MAMLATATPEVAEHDVEFPPCLAFLFQPARYKITYGGRGGAKSWGYARALVSMAASKPLRILCARETQKSIADSVHQLLEDQIHNVGLRAHYDIGKAEIKGHLGSEIIFAGLKHNVSNIKSLEGVDIVWVEEAQNVSKESWETLIPTIRKEGSEIWASFNPILETDDTYQRFVVNPPPMAVVRKVTWRDNPWFPDVLRIEMEHMRDTDPEGYAHVWEGECRSAVEGAVYGQEMKRAMAEGRITNVPVDRTRPVDTFWDLGYDDAMAIWCAQALPSGWYNVVDYLENSGQAIEWYLIQLQRRGYVYGNHWLPHDGVDAIIHKKLAQDRSRSIEQIMRAAGLSVRIGAKLLVSDGINAVRTILPQCRFDADKCYEGLRSMRMYQWGPPSASGALKREPLHDAASHGADAFRTLALNIKQPRAQMPTRPAARPAEGAFGWG